MYLSYYESAEECTISRNRALRELEKHGIDTDESPEIDNFYAELGIKEEYAAQSVLGWLGY